jgi:hypothetical protein
VVIIDNEFFFLAVTCSAKSDQMLITQVEKGTVRGKNNSGTGTDRFFLFVQRHKLFKK